MLELKPIWPIRSPSGTFTHVDTGAEHACAVTQHGTYKCWGWDHYDQSSPP